MSAARRAIEHPHQMDNDVDDENIVNTEPDNANNNSNPNGRINPSQRVIQNLAFESALRKQTITVTSTDQQPNSNNNTNNNPRINTNSSAAIIKDTQANYPHNDYDFLGEINAYEYDDQEGYNNNYNCYEPDANLKFISEAAIQSEQRVIAERLATQEQQYNNWEKLSRAKQGIQFSQDFNSQQQIKGQNNNKMDKLSNAANDDLRLTPFMNRLLITSISNSQSSLMPFGTFSKISFTPQQDAPFANPKPTDYNSDGLSILNKIVIMPLKDNNSNIAAPIAATKKKDVSSQPQQQQQLQQKQSPSSSLENPKLSPIVSFLPSGLSHLLNQRSLSTILQVSFRLRGNSQCNIILRSIDLSNEESVLLRFTKEGYGFDMRLFVLMGRYDTASNEYLFIKKCEIPQIKITEEHAITDYIDVQAKIVDIGTDQIHLKLHVNGVQKNPFKVQYKQCIVPNFEDFSIFIAGTGEDLALQKVIIEQVDRKSYLNRKSDGNNNSLSNGRGCSSSSSSAARCVCVINQTKWL